MTIRSPTLKTSETFLALNIGNTHVKAGFFAYSGPGTIPRLLATSSSKTHPIPTNSLEIKALMDELFGTFAGSDFKFANIASVGTSSVANLPVLVSSVVPRFSERLKADSRFRFLDQNSPFSFQLLGAQTDSLLLDGAESLPKELRSSNSVPNQPIKDCCQKSSTQKTGFEKRRPYASLGEVGMDRLVNIEACVHAYGTSCMVIDFGTATSISVVFRRKGKFYFAGGAIAPGIALSIRTLAAETAKLPEVPIGFSEKLIALNTTEAIQSGTVWGQIYMIEGLIPKIMKEVSVLGDPIEKVIFTGGLSSFLFPKLLSTQENSDTYLLQPDLTLEGIARFYDRIGN